MKNRVIAVILIIFFLCEVDIQSTNVRSERRVFRAEAVVEAATGVKIHSEKELIATISTALLNRKEKLTVKYSLPDYELDFDQLFDNVLAIDKKSTAKDGDYLAFSLSSWAAQAEMIGSNTTLNFEFTYKTSLKEEQALDSKIKGALQALELEKASQEQKVKAIHDYIIKRISYDSTLQKASAYEAMMDQSAVCEGYSMLAYRMFTEAGLESRIISGTGDGVAHAWNIVKVEGKWYNIDLTWDDPISSDGEPMLTYDYYLKNTKEFKDHKRDAKYKTEKFLKAYPISKTSYLSVE